MFSTILKNMINLVALGEITFGAVYVLGYLVVTAVSYVRGDDHCYAYIIITLAAAGHLVILMIRSAMRWWRGWVIRQVRSRLRKARGRMRSRLIRSGALKAEAVKKDEKM